MDFLSDINGVENIVFVMKVLIYMFILTCTKSSEIFTSDWKVLMVIVIILILSEQLKYDSAFFEEVMGW